jgi:hypothetical protein
MSVVRSIMVDEDKSRLYELSRRKPLEPRFTRRRETGKHWEIYV